MIRIGEINYLNVYPIYYFLKKEIKSNPELNFLEFVLGTPAFLNRELKAGNIDISPSSSFYYILNFKSSYIFRNLSISSKKRVKSIYLFTPKPIEDFRMGEILRITPETLTSLNLLKVLLAEFYKFDLSGFKFIISRPNEKLEFDSESNNYETGKEIFLHIGNNALKFSKHIPKDYFAYDLADLWYKFTGYPFVFALFIIRKDSYDMNKKEFDILYEYFIKSKEKAVSGFKEAALSVLKPDEYEFISYEELMDYWTECLNFNFGGEEIKGFNLYCDLLYKNRLISYIPALNFV